jgi:hypothetical protein
MKIFFLKKKEFVPIDSLISRLTQIRLLHLNRHTGFVQIVGDLFTMGSHNP